MHTNSRLLFEKYAKPAIERGARVLEIGPDRFPSTFCRLSQDREAAVWHTLDISDNPNLTYSGSAEYAFHIPDDSYDLVISGQVIEHVRKPWKWLREVARVTRVGGLVITINPVSWIYHGAPVDCWRIYPEGMKALYEHAALSVLMSHWECLETPQFRKHSPGVSREQQSRRRRVLGPMLGLLGFAVEAAFDTVTIGRKDASSPREKARDPRPLV